MELSITKDEKGYLQVDVPSPEQLLQLMQESRHKLLSRSIVEKKCSDGGAIVSVTGTQDFDRYDNDVVVALYVASHKSMRQIARELNLDVSTVSRRVKKWAEKNAELRGGIATAREVELARLDEMLEQVDGAYMDPEKRYSTRLHILDRKYRLLGLSSAGPQVVVGIGVQQARAAPRVVDSVADHISDESE